MLSQILLSRRTLWPVLWLGTSIWAQTVPPIASQPHGAVPLRPLAPVLLRYRVRSSNFPWRLNAELLWQTDGRNYEASLVLRALGMERSQRSRGRISASGVEPVHFAEMMRTEEHARFDHGHRVVAFQPPQPEVSLSAGAQDRLSVLPQLATLFASDPSRYTSGTRLRLQVVSGHGADIWQFSVAGSETLLLPGGEQACVKLVRPADADNDQRLEIWLAPRMGYVPVRVLATEANGDQVDQQWEGNSTPPIWGGPDVAP